MKQIIIVAGGTGNLGKRIVRALLAKDTEVRVLARLSTDSEKLRKLESSGAKIFKVDMSHPEEIAKACKGASCVVSALAGLRDVVIDAQKVLLEGAVAAGVPRFIPSDYSLDFTQLDPGNNRNLDLRREFHQILDKAPIAATSIFNGPFTELLTNEMPMILPKFRSVLFWGDADQKMDFTTMDDVAAFTAKVALDYSTPRYLWIAGDQISAREIRDIQSALSKEKFRLIRAGGIGLLNTFITIGRTLSPAEKDLYPAWQGMQYMRDMAEGKAKVSLYDNDRYGERKWTKVKNVLEQKKAQKH
ncbi:NmrA family NAD(P)-binding protein [Anditalea andensis]|uniref:NmrA family protein n=1 Tax=Anditalea andensis TaxID=1048983 RepID=A0A074L4Y3_9BACT|nr:NmrA family NAD(P)-binding protein [Anditalea andensis]KEO74908.1 NmrA family protein [Anditalea andensis]